AGGQPFLGDVVDASKRQVVADVLVPERRRLLRRAVEVLPKADPERLAEAVDELLVACSVYRAYVRPGDEADELARQRMQDALETASAARPDLKAELQQLADTALSPIDEA